MNGYMNRYMKRLVVLLGLLSSLVGTACAVTYPSHYAILNETSTIQPGNPTIWVASGTVNNLNASTFTVSAIQWPNGTIQVSSPTVAGGSFINNQATLQSGATFYVSSGTVQGQLTVSTVSASAVLINGQGIFNGTYSPTITGCGTVGSNAGFYQQIGNMVHVWGSFQAGTTTAETMSITIPVGSITYTNRLPTNGSVAIGTLFNMNGAQGAFSYCAFVLFADGSTTSAVFVTVNTPADGTAAWPKENGNSLATSNAYQAYDFWYAVQ